MSVEKIIERDVVESSIRHEDTNSMFIFEGNLGMNTCVWFVKAPDKSKAKRALYETYRKFHNYKTFEEFRKMWFEPRSDFLPARVSFVGMGYISLNLNRTVTNVTVSDEIKIHNSNIISIGWSE